MIRNIDYLKDKKDFAKLCQFCNSAKIKQAIAGVQQLFDCTMDRSFN